MKKLALILSVLCMLGCSETELTPEQERILGTWQLSEFCVGPGNGDCPAQVATAITTQILEFKKNGSFIEKIPQPGKFQTPIVSSGEYQLAGSGKIRFKFDDKATFAQEVQWNYVLAENSLTILPQCFEGCSYTYRRQ